MITPAFVTDRLNVFGMPIQGIHYNRERHCFVAYHNDVDWPGQVICITLDVNGPPRDNGVFVDWIETTASCRGEGLGKEFFEGLEKHLKRPIDREGLDEACESVLIGEASKA